MSTNNKAQGVPFGRSIARELSPTEMEAIGGGDGDSFTLTNCVRSIEYDCGDGSQTD